MSTAHMWGEESEQLCCSYVVLLLGLGGVTEFAAMPPVGGGARAKKLSMRWR